MERWKGYAVCRIPIVLREVVVPRPVADPAFGGGGHNGKCTRIYYIYSRCIFIVVTDNAIDFLFSTLHTTPFHYEALKIGSR